MKYYRDYTEKDCTNMADAYLKEYAGLTHTEMLMRWASNLGAGSVIVGLILRLRELEAKQQTQPPPSDA